MWLYINSLSRSLFRQRKCFILCCYTNLSTSVQLKNMFKERNIYNTYSSRSTIDWSKFQQIAQIDKLIEGGTFPLNLSFKFLRQDYFQLYIQLNKIKKNEDRKSIIKYLHQLNQHAEHLIYNSEIADSHVLMHTFLQSVMDLHSFVYKGGSCIDEDQIDLPFNRHLVKLAMDNKQFRLIYHYVKNNQANKLENLCRAVYELGLPYLVKGYFNAVVDIKFKQGLAQALSVSFNPKELKTLGNIKHYLQILNEHRLLLNNDPQLQAVPSLLFSLVASDKNFPLCLESIRYCLKILQNQNIAPNKLTFITTLKQIQAAAFKNFSEDYINAYLRLLKSLRIYAKQTCFEDLSGFTEFVNCIQKDQLFPFFNDEQKILYGDISEDIRLNQLGISNLIQLTVDKNESQLRNLFTQLSESTIKQLSQMFQEEVSKNKDQYTTFMTISNKKKLIVESSFGIVDKDLVLKPEYLTSHIIENEDSLQKLIPFFEQAEGNSKKIIVINIIKHLEGNLSSCTSKTGFRNALKRIHEIYKLNKNLFKFIKQQSNVIEKTITRAMVEELQRKNEKDVNLEFFEEILFLARNTESQIDHALIKKIIGSNLSKFSHNQLAAIFYLVCTMSTPDDQLIQDLQQYITKIIDKFNQQQIHLILKSLPNIQNRLFFTQPLIEIIKNRAVKPEYANVVCDLIYHKLKKEARRFNYYRPILENLRKALGTSDNYVELLNLARVIKQVSKFENVNDLVKLYCNKVIKSDVFKQEEIAFIYSTLLQNKFHQESLFEDAMIKLEKEIMRMIKQKKLKSFDVGRIIHALTICLMSVRRDDMLEFALSESLNSEFYKQLKTNSIDFGLYSMVFWSHSLVNHQKLLPIFIKDTRSIREEMLSAVDGCKLQASKQKLFDTDLQSQIQDIHFNQLQEGSYFLSELCTNIDDTEKKSFHKMIERLETHPYFAQKSQLQITTMDALSYFQQSALFILQNMLGKENVLQEYKGVKPFIVDIFVPSKKLIIECNGKQHYINGKLKFNNKAKLDLIQKRGFTVIEIPISEWNNLKVSQREQFLKEKVQSIN